MKNSKKIELKEQEILNMVELIYGDNGLVLKLTDQAVRKLQSDEEQQEVLAMVEIIYEGNEPKIRLKESARNKLKKGRKKKSRKIKWFAGATVAVVLIGALTVEELQYGWITNKAKNLFKNFGAQDLNKDSITEVLANLPLNNDGIISVTVPMGVKPLDNEQKELFYYLSDEEFAKYYVYDDGKQVELQEVTDDTRDNEKIQYFKTANGEIATGYIGIENEYAEFLKLHDEIKSTISPTDKTAYSTPLIPVIYEVSDLYKVPDGYELYCDDKSVGEFAELAYIDYDETETNNEHFSKIYSIPENFLENFIPVTKEAYKVLSYGDELKADLVDTYEMYSQVKGNMGYAYEETTNRSR